MYKDWQSDRELCINYLLTCENPTVPVFQFFINSNGKVGMNGDAFAVGDGVKAGAKKFAVVVESVIGTVTVRNSK